jgi:hypothetical protein
VRCLRAICKSENSPRGTWRSRPEHDLCTLDRGMFPIADRPGRRTISHYLHNQHRCQESSCAGAPPERSQRAAQLRHLSRRSRTVWRSLRPRNRSDARRTSTAERRTGRGRQVSTAPPASDVRIAGCALPIAVPVHVRRSPNTYVPQGIRKFVSKGRLKYQDLLKIRVFLKTLVLAIRFKRSHQHRKQAVTGFF